LSEEGGVGRRVLKREAFKNPQKKKTPAKGENPVKKDKVGGRRK